MKYINYKPQVCVMLLVMALLLALTPSSTASIIDYRIDVVVYNLENKTTINLETKIAVSTERGSISISGSYAASINNNIREGITILDLLDLTKTNLVPTISPLGVSLYEDKLVYYDFNEIYLYNITLNVTQKISDNRSTIQYISFNDNYLLFKEIKLNKEWYIYNFENKEIIELGPYRNAIMHGDQIFLEEYDNNKKSILLSLYYLSNNTKQKIYSGKGDTRIISFQESYIIWKLENGTYYIDNRDNQNGSYWGGSGKKLTDFSGYDSKIIYIDKISYYSDEIMIYDINLGILWKITDTDDINEAIPQMSGSYIIWLATHIPDTVSYILMNINPLLLLCIPISFIVFLLIFIKIISKKIRRV